MEYSAVYPSKGRPLNILKIQKLELHICSAGCRVSPMKFIMELFTLLSYCIPFVTIPVFAVSAILMIRTFFAEQAPEQSKKRRRYLGYMLVSFLFFCPIFWGGVYFSFYCIPFFTIPAFVISAILMIRTYFVEQTPEESRKRRRYLGCMLVSFLLFLLFFGGVILMLSCVID